MDLSNAVTVFQDLKSKISEQRDYLESHETVTRVVLVDPVLHLLGWDVKDPNLVELEYRTAEENIERADYLLKAENTSVAVVEAKKLGTPITSKERRQVKEYADYAEVSWCALTDGSRWMIYDLDDGRNPETMKPKVELDIQNNPSSELVLQCLVLWQQNLSSNSGPILAEMPVFKPIGSEESGRDDKQHISDIPGEDWYRITSEGFTPTGNKPTHVRFDNRSQAVKNWQDFAVRFATWMVEEGKISQEDCPVPLNARGVKYIISTAPRHQDGQDFHSGKKLPSGMWMDTHHSAASLVRHIRKLALQYDVDPDTIYVKMT